MSNGKYMIIPIKASVEPNAASELYFIISTYLEKKSTWQLWYFFFFVPIYPEVHQVLDILGEWVAPKTPFAFLSLISNGIF